MYFYMDVIKSQLHRYMYRNHPIAVVPYCNDAGFPILHNASFDFAYLKQDLE